MYAIIQSRHMTLVDSSGALNIAISVLAVARRLSMIPLLRKLSNCCHALDSGWKKGMKIIRMIGEPPLNSAIRQPHSVLKVVVAQTPTIEALADASTALPWMKALPM